MKKILALLVGLVLAGCGKDNVEYRLINDYELSCEILGAKASKEDYEEGVMTPIDGEFALFFCRIDDPETGVHRKVIAMTSREMPNGVLQSKFFGDFRVKYYRTGIRERIYMTESQIEEIKNHLRDKEKKN